MKISLAEWKKIEAAVAGMRSAAELAESAMADIVFKHQKAGNADEVNLLLSIELDMHEVRTKSFQGRLGAIHPQSEWMGGDTDNPRNHKLREPDCCGYNGRYFTTEELAEAGAENHGPCHWTFDKGKIDGSEKS